MTPDNSMDPNAICDGPPSGAYISKGAYDDVCRERDKLVEKLRQVDSFRRHDGRGSMQVGLLILIGLQTHPENAQQS